MIIDYNEQSVFTKSIDIVDVGNFTLRCIGSGMTEYYIVVKTIMGKTNIFKFGPIMPETQLLTNDFTATNKIIDYKESKICKEVNTYINDPKKEIENVEEVTIPEALQEFPNIETALMEN